MMFNPWRCDDGWAQYISKPRNPKKVEEGLDRLLLWTNSFKQIFSYRCLFWFNLLQRITMPICSLIDELTLYNTIFSRNVHWCSFNSNHSLHFLLYLALGISNTSFLTWWSWLFVDIHQEKSQFIFPESVLRQTAKVVSSQWYASINGHIPGILFSIIASNENGQARPNDLKSFSKNAYFNWNYLKMLPEDLIEFLMLHREHW